MKEKHSINILLRNNNIFSLKFIKIFLLSAIICIGLPVKGYTQSSVNISLKLKNETIRTAFDLIEKQSNYVFFFEDKVEKELDKRISINQNIPINSLLDKLLSDANLKYQIVNNQILVSLKDPKLSAKKTKTIAGRVVDDNNGALLAVVRIVGTTKGTLCDSDGRYILEDVSEDSKIEFSLIGYQTITVPVTKDDYPVINAVLTNKQKDLEDIVVIGYGTTSQRFNTGSVSQLTAKEIEAQPVTNVLQALQGRVPGVFITQSNGLPGTAMSILIRGANSMTQKNEPLFIIDGVPFLSTAINAQSSDYIIDGANGSTSPLNSINPQDIESLEILKDADATAIYGSRAANGVVLITTKKGKVGKTRIDVQFNTGISKVPKFVKTLGTDEYLSLRKKAFENSGITPNAINALDLTVWDQNAYTDFQKLLIGNTANVYDASIALSGGNEYTSFRISGTYHKEDNVFIGDQGYSRASVNMSVNHKSADNRFEVGASAIYGADKNTVSITDLTSLAYELPPNFPLYNADGSLYWTGDYGGPTNPMGYLNRKNRDEGSNLIGNMNLRYTIIEGLNLKTSLGYNRVEMNQVRLTPLSAQDPGLSPSSFSIFSSNYTNSYIIEPFLTYDKNVWKGKLEVLLGATWQHRISKQPYYTIASDFLSDDFLETISAAQTVSTTSASNEYKYASVFGRVKYNLLDKYILNINVRRDGSSRFGPNNRYGNFGSLGFAWILNEEPWIALPQWISFAKLRSSYGIVGSDNIGDYQYLDSYASTSYIYNGIAGLYPARVANDDYKWEETRKAEIALDLKFLKDRISMSVSYYDNMTDNQLISYTLSPQAGFGSYQANLPAKVKNTGWEILLSSNNIENKDFSWSSRFSISANKNKLEAFPNIENTSYYTQYVVGNALSAYYRYKYTGFDKETGLPTVADLNGDGRITTGFSANNLGDRYYVGATYPKYYGGLGNSFIYKDFALDLFFQFVKQDGLSMLTSSYTVPGQGLKNGSKELINEYLSAGLPTLNQVTASYDDAYTAYSRYLASDAMIEDASFIRLKNVNISYQVPAKILQKIKVKNLRLYLQGENLFTITKYKGFDPESRGLALPPLRTYLVGIQCSF